MNKQQLLKSVLAQIAEIEVFLEDLYARHDEGLFDNVFENLVSMKRAIVEVMLDQEFRYPGESPNTYAHRGAASLPNTRVPESPALPRAPEDLACAP